MTRFRNNPPYSGLRSSRCCDTLSRREALQREGIFLLPVPTQRQLQQEPRTADTFQTSPVRARLQIRNGLDLNPGNNVSCVLTTSISDTRSVLSDGPVLSKAELWSKQHLLKKLEGKMNVAKSEMIPPSRGERLKVSALQHRSSRALHAAHGL